MDSEQKFWVSVWSLASIVLCTLIICITLGMQLTNEKVLKADTCAKVIAINGDAYGKLTVLCATKP